MAVFLRVFFFILLSFGETLDFQSSTSKKGKDYVLLVAGSNGWWNYRHQADVAHAYHLIKSNGVPEENIIVMMYDDIADDANNPYPGKLFNRPGGPDVYQGLKIDYRGDDVNPDNFLNVLQGKHHKVKGGNGRVLKSSKNDRIFVYFTDHGATGLMCFPNDVLTKEDLNNALTSMHKEKRYDQLVFYLETCESGSMFDGVLEKEMNIYAMTAANPDESSWATYCDTADLPCLGDLFSVNWMEDSEKHNLKVETLNTQYKDVKDMTNESHVMQYGNLLITTEVVGLFEGEGRAKSTRLTTTTSTTTTSTTTTPTTTTPNTTTPNQTTTTSTAAHLIKKLSGSLESRGEFQEQHLKVSWPARDIELMHLKKLQRIANNMQTSKVLQRRIAEIHEDRRNIEAVYMSVVANLLDDAKGRKQMMEERNAVEDMKCHNDVVKAFDSICIDVNKFDYALKYIYVLNNLCVKIGDPKKIIEAMDATCSTMGKHYF